MQHNKKKERKRETEVKRRHNRKINNRNSTTAKTKQDR